MKFWGVEKNLKRFRVLMRITFESGVAGVRYDK
jgi:hypothetical protein